MASSVLRLDALRDRFLRARPPSTNTSVNTSIVLNVAQWSKFELQTLTSNLGCGSFRLHNGPAAQFLTGRWFPGGLHVRSPLLLTIAAASLLGGAALQQSQRRLNPVIEVL